MAVTEEISKAIAEAMVPGRYLVDTLPFSKPAGSAIDDLHIKWHTT